MPRPTASCGARAAVWSCSNGSPTRGVTGTARIRQITFFLAFLLLAREAHSNEPKRAPEFVRGRYAHLFGALEVGRGLRLNNPYRLETVLGDDAESLSLTATYLDVSAGAAFGRADLLQHGAALHASFALHGIPQEVLTPSYVAIARSTP